ncbi:RAD51-associated protein 1 [Leptodactylus fuscus]|uniref:RAD51-associated protein 1 n=1 Tax=Leptodactylus fuscus TaxID=238119 RepID=UPI003F4F0DFF
MDRPSRSEHPDSLSSDYNLVGVARSILFFRNKKSVDYSQFLDLEDDDEDFAASAPVSKKARVEPKKEKREKPTKKSHKEEVTPDNSQKKRLPLEDKLYQRDLEVALALSVKETSVVIENDENIPRNGINSPFGPEASAPCTPEDTYTCIKEPDVSERSFTNCSVDSGTLGLDEITDDNEDTGRGRRQAASKAITEQRKLLREDSGDEEEEDEFNPDTAADEDSESDASFSGEDDEEFEVKKPKKPSKTSKSAQKQKPQSGKKEKKVPKAQKAAAEPPIKVKIKIKPMPERKAPINSPAAPKPALHSSPPVGMKRPAWTPPASCGAAKSPLSGVTVKSPNQGLRLGLSRLARVKPLHPSTGLH